MRIGNQGLPKLPIAELYGISALVRAAVNPVQIAGYRPLLHTVRNFADAQKCDQKLFTAFYKQMREQGINLAPSGFETGMVSFAHTDDDFNKALEAARAVRF